ncbi:MAG: DUF1800 domain-containing protein [Candidatus Sedimenticola sp. 20ELBAFRAG]
MFAKQRKLILLLILAAPSIVQALPFQDARHLLNRTGFTASQVEVDELSSLDRRSAVDHLIRKAASDFLHPLPDWHDEPLPDRRQLRKAGAEKKKALRKLNRKRGMELKGWWYRQMVESDSPLAERMTLFWHNHFTSSLKKVNLPQLMLRQHLLLRGEALGDFSAMLHAVARDPAMLIYLDSRNNRKKQPNENFARELLELFTLGEGHYSEQDIKEAARAFTGYAIDRDSGEFTLRQRQHDQGAKRFLGRTGRWGGEDIVNILLENPRSAEFISRKLWDEFITLDPAPGQMESISNEFRRGGFHIGRLLGMVLMSDQFWDQRNRGSRIKSPVELLVGTMRFFDIPADDGNLLARTGRNLGQNLFDPPNVKGWPGGEAWIDSNTLLARRQVIERLTQGREMKRGKKRNMASRMMRQRISMQPDTPDQRRRLQQLLLPLPPVNDPDAENLADYLRQQLLDPVYQLN